MRRKLLVFLILMILPFTINAATANISCKSVVNPGDTVNCDYNISFSEMINSLNASYELNGLGYISFNKNASLNMVNSSSSGFKLTANNIVPNTLKVGTITLQIPSNALPGQTYRFRIVNASIVKANETNEVINLPDTSVLFRIANTDNTLKSLSVDNYQLVPEFNPNITNYSVKEIKEEKININAKTNDSNASVKGSGKKTLKYGDNNIKITVTSESGVKKEYVIKANRLDLRDKTNTLDSLKVGDFKLNPSFSKKTVKYKIDTPPRTTEVDLDATLTSDKSKFVKKYGPRTVNLNYGKNEYKIKVQAENEKIKTYTLIIEREDDRDPNNFLKSLTISSGEIKFDRNITSYMVSVPNNVDDFRISAETESLKAKLDIKTPNEFKVGTNKFILTVTAENEKTKNYVLLVDRELPDNQKKDKTKFIKDLKVNNNGMKIKFDPNVTTYDLEIAGQDTLTFDYDLSEGVTAEITGNEDLDEGSSVIIILSHENGDAIMYTFNIKIASFYAGDDVEPIEKVKVNYNWKFFTMIGLTLIILTEIFFFIKLAIKRNKK